jgi:glucosylceramidase
MFAKAARAAPGGAAKSEYTRRPMKRLASSLAGLLLLLPGCARTAPTPSPASAEPAVAAPEAAPEPQSRGARWIVTTGAAPFANGALPTAERQGAAEVVVLADQARHEVSGFGGAFNEHGWDALNVLSEGERQAALAALFDPGTGLGLSYGRIPVGASDYALDRYTLDEAPGDYAMARFSIERDRRWLIPFIQAALKLRPGLKLWASAWTPPTWMKTNGAFDGGAFKDEPKVYAAYALYLARFVESYRAEGIDVSMVVPQNEPGQLTRYPSCDWTPAQYVTFIRDHLGPTFQRRSLSTQIFVGTVNTADWDILSVLKDPGVSRVIAGAALQWHALSRVAPVHAAFPSLTIMQSETECGNNHWQPGFNPERAPNDFRYAAYTFRKLRDFISAGASSYMLWNLVLDEHGKNIDSERPWPQNGAIIVDRKAKQVTLTPMYWVTKHFSALLQPGARVVASSGAFADQIVFLNPDGTRVVEPLNESAAPLTLTIVDGSRRQPVELPPQSFGTLLLPRG